MDGGSGGNDAEDEDQQGSRQALPTDGYRRIRRRQANKSHILTKKTSKRKRRLTQPALVSKADEGRVKRLLGK